MIEKNTLISAKVRAAMNAGFTTHDLARLNAELLLDGWQVLREPATPHVLMAVILFKRPSRRKETGIASTLLPLEVLHMMSFIVEFQNDDAWYVHKNRLTDPHVVMTWNECIATWRQMTA